MSCEESETEPTGDKNCINSKHEPFKPFKKFIFENVDKSVGPKELLDHLNLDKFRRGYVSVCMPLDRQGHTQGSADVIAPYTFSPHILNFNRNPCLTLRGKQLAVSIDKSKTRQRKQVWVKTDLGVVTSQRCDDVIRPLRETEITVMQALVDAGAGYKMCMQDRYRNKTNIPDIIDRAYLSGVEKIVLKSHTLREAINARKVAHRYPGIVYFTAGVHTSQGVKWKGEATLSVLRELIQDPQCVAVGEIGMSRDIHDKEKQEEIFTTQVELACDLGKPLLIRVKCMMEETLEILSKFEKRLPAVCVSDMFLSDGSVDLYYAKGFYISISGYSYQMNDIPWVTKWLHGLLESTPNPRILLASDSPTSFPSTVDKVNLSALNFRASCVGIPLVYRITERCLSLAKKYNLSNWNEPMSLQNLVELIGLAIEPETMATLSRRCSYDFFNFLEVDKNLRPLHIVRALPEEDAQGDSGSEEDEDARAEDNDCERTQSEKTKSTEETADDQIILSRKTISENKQTSVSDREKRVNSVTSMRLFLAASVPLLAVLVYMLLLWTFY